MFVELRLPTLLLDRSEQDSRLADFDLLTSFLLYVHVFMVILVMMANFRVPKKMPKKCSKL